MYKNIVCNMCVIAHKLLGQRLKYYIEPMTHKKTENVILTFHYIM